MTELQIVLLVWGVCLVYMYVFKELKRKNANLPLFVIYILGLLNLIAGILAGPVLFLIAACHWLHGILTGEIGINDKGE